LISDRHRSTDEDAAAGINTPAARSDRDEQAYCWTMARAIGHPSRIAGLTEGAAGKLLERGVADIAGVEAYSAISELLRLAQFASDRWTELTG